MSETVKLRCRHSTQGVTLNQAQEFTNALWDFLKDPSNLKNIDAPIKPLFHVPRDMDFSPERNTVSTGLWHLECNAPGIFHWEMRTLMRSHSIFFTAKLRYLKDEDRWIVPAIDIGRLFPKR